MRRRQVPAAFARPMGGALTWKRSDGKGKFRFLAVFVSDLDREVEGLQGLGIAPRVGFKEHRNSHKCRQDGKQNRKIRLSELSDKSTAIPFILTFS